METGRRPIVGSDADARRRLVPIDVRFRWRQGRVWIWCDLLVLAVLSVQLRGGLAAIRKILPQQPSYAGGMVAGLMWQGTPAALTPTNFTIMFPDGITPVASERFEIHLPGFGGAYNSFGATATSTVLRGNFLPSQNGIKAYSRAYSAAHEQNIAGCIDAAEWDPKREVLKILVGTCGTFTLFDGVTIDEGYLRQFYQRGALPSGKGPLP